VHPRQASTPSCICESPRDHFLLYARYVTSSTNAGADERVKRWRRLTSSSNSFQVASVRIIESNVFAPQLIELNRAIAFVGLHGAGKSLLMRVIEAAFGHSTSSHTPPFLPDESYILSRALQLTGTIEVTLKTPKGPVSHIVDLHLPGDERRNIWKREEANSFSAWYMDPIIALRWLDYMFDNYNFAAAFEETESGRSLKKPDLSALRNILGRPYDRVTVRSVFIDDGVGDDLHLPLITAELGSKVLDNAVMSQGELWVHYTNWFLEHEVSEGALVLLDEPEAFIAARGRRPLIDHVCHEALRRGLQLFIATHSPEMLSRYPLKNIRVCVASDDGLRVHEPTSLFQIHEIIGIETPVRGVVLVEDNLAKQLLVAVFSRYDTALTREIDIVPMNGASNVRAAMKQLRFADRLTFIAVLDSDERHKSSDRTSDAKNSILFLPGNKPPEEDLLQGAITQISLVAKLINVRTRDLLTAIDTTQDLDHQYRIGAVAQQLGYPEGAFTSMLIQAWLRQPETARMAEDLARDVRNRLRVPGQVG
jgi:hypothetical protein